MYIEVNDEAALLSEKQSQLILDLLDLAGKNENIESTAEISLTFVNNEEIQEINRDYRNIDRPTDVISFALEDEMIDEEVDYGEDAPPRMLGDIIISVERAKEQAIDYSHSLDRELGFLAVHGFLHLLGYDHQNEAEEKEMFSKQEKILEVFGLER